VSLRDLPATVADVTGLGDSPFPGHSLMRFLSPDSPQDREPSLSEVDAPVKSAPNQGRSPVFRGPLKAVALGNQVYIHHAAGKEELFDVESDPGQLHNLANQQQSQRSLDVLRSTLSRLLEGDGGLKYTGARF
jgi:hypothetical protein